MNKSMLCDAIKGYNLVQFNYDGGTCVVEPHMVAYNEAEHLSLSGWFVRGYSESGSGQGWREYLLSGISSLTVLSETFSGPRPGYNPTGGKKFHSVQCAL
jgi:hypothetical protein